METPLRLRLGIKGQQWEISAPSGTPLKAALSALSQPLVSTWSAEGVICHSDDELGEFPLVDGADLTPIQRGHAKTSSLRLVVTSGPHLGETWLICPGTHSLGRDHPLLVGDPLVSREHAQLAMEYGALTVEDIGSANGTFLNGKPLEPHQPVLWHLGEFLRIGGSELRLSLDTPFSGDQSAHQGRMPRPGVQPIEAPDALELSWPAQEPEAARHPLRLIAALLPLPLGLAAAYFFHSTMLLLLMAASPIIMLITAFEDRRNGTHQHRVDAQKRAAHLHAVASRMTAQLHKETAFRRRRFLSADDIHQATLGRIDGLDTASAHWPFDIRLGIGACHSSSFFRLENGVHHPVLEDVPVTCTLTPGSLVHLACDDEIRPQVLAQVMAAIIVHGAPGTRPPCLASPTLALLTDDRLDVVIRPNVSAMVDSFENSTAQHNGVLVLEEDRALTTDQLRELTQRGFAVLWVGQRCPGAVDHRFAIHAGYLASTGPKGTVFTADLPDIPWLQSIILGSRRWQPRAYPHSVNTSLPTRIVPADLGMPSQPQWTSHPQMAVPIGVDHNGTCVLDLEKYGPHALVAGTTGSGKSEFLLAYLRGLVTLNSPEQVTAILIDYKGGATFGPLAHVPHVVGVICDLDVGLAERALIGLRAEIHRREALLRNHGASSFTAYQELLNKPALPRLFVVVDEFRVLAEELPDFVSGLVRIAAVGRSLGIHLILATQRPGGVVSAEMRANIDARICLRVRERADSIDVLESPVAAQIDRMTPGRAYIALAGEKPCEVQTLYTSGLAQHSATSIHVHPVDEGQAPVACPACHNITQSETNDLTQSVTACQVAAHDMPAPHKPVLPPLGEHVDPAQHDQWVSWSDLTQQVCLPQPGTNPSCIGFVDLPESQAQPGVAPEKTHHVSICGASRTGRTNAARVIAQSLDPSGTHTWWVTSDDECAAHHVRPDDINDVAALMNDLMAENAPQLLVIDGWEPFHETLLMLNHGMAADDFLSLIARAHRIPLQIIVTGGRTLMTSKLSALFEVRFIMRHNDIGEYSLAGLRPTSIPAEMPPGRALVLPHGRIVQFGQGRPTKPDHPVQSAVAPKQR